MGGSRYGESNPRAELSDADVELMRQLWDSEAHLLSHKDRRKKFWTRRRLAEKFEVSERQVENIVYYLQRTSRCDA